MDGIKRECSFCFSIIIEYAKHIAQPPRISCFSIYKITSIHPFDLCHFIHKTFLLFFHTTLLLLLKVCEWERRETQRLDVLRRHINLWNACNILLFCYYTCLNQWRWICDVRRVWGEFMIKLLILFAMSGDVYAHSWKLGAVCKIM